MQRGVVKAVTLSSWMTEQGPTMGPDLISPMLNPSRQLLAKEEAEDLMYGRTTRIYKARPSIQTIGHFARSIDYITQVLCV